MPKKEEKNSSFLIYNIVSLDKTVGKAETFSWREFECELVVKYLENLTIEKTCCNFELR